MQFEKLPVLMSTQAGGEFYKLIWRHERYLPLKEAPNVLVKCALVFTQVNEYWVTGLGRYTQVNG